MSSITHNPTSEAWSFDESKADYVELCKKLWPTAQHDKTRITILSFSVNRCFTINITDANGDAHEYVLRYPIKLDEHKRSDKDYCVALTRHVCTLQWLNKHAPEAKAPKVIKYDCSKNNPIHMPFMILNRIPGQPLSEVLLHLTDKQCLDLGLGLGLWYEQTRNVTMPRAGFVNASNEVKDLITTDATIAIQPFGMSDIVDMVQAIDEAATTDRTVPGINEPLDLNTKEVLNNAFLRRLGSLLHINDPKGLDSVKLDHCRGILNMMAERGAFNDNENQRFSLWHTDLFPRNIMVDLTKTGTDIISGIVDWDAPVFAPGFVACMPPAWLWAPNTYTHKVGDFIGVFGYEDVKPETNTLKQVKAAFDNKAGDFYTKTAYNREYAAARIFVDYVQARDWRNHPLFEKRNKFVDEWMQTDMLSLN